MKLLFFLHIVMTVLLVSVQSTEIPKTALMQFVLQWPPTFCIKLARSKESEKCIETIPQKFTLHGVWPADSRGNGLSVTQNKCPTWDPDSWEDVLGTMENQLLTFWPPIRENSGPWDLWKHEWREHGVCVGRDYKPETYFRTAININEMLQQGNLFNYLKTDGIIACDSLSFTRAEVVKAVQKVFGSRSRDIYLTCIPIDEKNDTHVYLSEVFLCTSVNGRSFTSCPQQTAPRSCPTGAKAPRIMLPHPQKQDVWVAARSSGRWDILLGKGSYQIESLQGEPEPLNWNISNLKRYYF